MMLAVFFAALSWSSPHVISSAGIALAPEIAMNGSGGAVAVWDEETGPDCATSPASLTCIHTVETAYRSRSDAPWDTGHAIARPGVGARPTAAINTRGDAAVLWVHDIGTFRTVQATLRHGPDGDFPNPNDLSDYVYEVRAHHIALDDAGNAVAVWSQRRPDGTFDVLAEIRIARLGYWGSGTLLSSGAVGAGPSLAVTPDGKALVVWIENGVVKAIDGDLATATWNRAVALSEPSGEAVDEPQVAVDRAGDAVAAWRWRDQPRDPTIVQATFRPAGAGWESKTDLGESGLGSPSPPSVAIDASGNASALWVHGVDGVVEFASRSHSDGAWSRAVDVARGATSDAQLAVDPRGNGVALWNDATTKTLDASVWPAAARAWQPAVMLSAAGTTGATLAVDDAGNASALWNAPEGDRVDVQTADRPGDWALTLTNEGPPTVRGRTRVGATVTCNRGVWTGTIPISFAYGWLRNGHAIRGEKRSSYRVRRRDAGALLACSVTATNAGRSLSATSRPVRVRR